MPAPTPSPPPVFNRTSHPTDPTHLLIVHTIISNKITDQHKNSVLPQFIKLFAM